MAVLKSDLQPQLSDLYLDHALAVGLHGLTYIRYRRY